MAYEYHPNTNRTPTEYQPNAIRIPSEYQLTIDYLLCLHAQSEHTSPSAARARFTKIFIVATERGDRVNNQYDCQLVQMYFRKRNGTSPLFPQQMSPFEKRLTHKHVSNTKT